MTTRTARPTYLNLLTIRQPVTAVLSILHRLSGVLLFLTIPALIYWLGLSVRSAEGYAEAMALLRHPWVETGAILLVWALTHHLLAGIRFLLLDLDIGLSLRTARGSAWLVFGLEFVVMGWLATRILP
jgi:succinate dehydrogenase / fumarate reductase cytochrome b subunit